MHKTLKDWHDAYGTGHGVYKTMLGGISIFNRHCQSFTRKVILFSKTENEGIRKRRCIGYYCLVCERIISGGL